MVSDCSPATGANRQWNKESVEFLHQEEAEAERHWPKHSQTTFRDWRRRESTRSQKKQWESLWRIQWIEENHKKREFRQGNCDSLRTTTNPRILPRQICSLPWEPHLKFLFPAAELQQAWYWPLWKWKHKPLRSWFQFHPFPSHFNHNSTPLDAYQTHR